jgi:hypothetical protein
VTVATAGWDAAALRRDQLNDQDIGPILEDVVIRQCPERKDIANRYPTYKTYWTQWKSLAVRNGTLKRRWESTDIRSKIAQLILPRSRVNNVLTKLNGGPSGGHLGVNKTLNKVQQRH